MKRNWYLGCIVLVCLCIPIALSPKGSVGQSQGSVARPQSMPSRAPTDKHVGDSACKSAGHAPNITTRPVQNVFVLRKDVGGLITDKRSLDEDRLRTRVLACAQAEDELMKLTGLLNKRWSKDSVLATGACLMEDWDKTYSPSLQRPKAFLALLVYTEAHERLRGLTDDGRLLVTFQERDRVAKVREGASDALDKYYKAILGDDSKWPKDVREELQYNVTSVLDDYGVQQMLTEPLWKGMSRDKKFRWDMLGIMSSLANEDTLKRLLQLRDSQDWPEEERQRIETGVKDVRWWLERQHRQGTGPKTTDDAPNVVISDEEHKLMERRVADMRDGKGPAVAVCGSTARQRLFQALMVTYVKIDANVAHLSYSPCDDETQAVGRFLDGGELLVLDNPPSDKALAVHGEKWNALKPDKKVVAAHAVAIIVNPAIKLKSLTIEQVRSIFSGQTTDWKDLDAGEGKIAAYVLGSSNPASEVFRKEVLASEKLKGVDFKKGTAAAVAAVSMDKAAIAFVDLAEIPAAGQTIKVIPIGPADKAVAPTAKAIRDGTYPLAHSLYVYVNPKASDTTKDFVAFIVACGGPEPCPFTDNVKVVADAFLKDGMIPLADAAIERMAKDAAAAKAKEPTTKPAKAK
jgi:ABC-type phosphate transport system substrate-binding protein